jgi:hypothetical protein
MLLLSNFKVFLPKAEIFQDSEKIILCLSLRGSKDSWYSFITRHIDIIKNVDRVLIEILYEAPFLHFFNQVEEFINENKLDLNKFLIIESGIDKLNKLNSIYYPIFFDRLHNNIKIPIKDRTKHFISLARSSRPSRILLTQEYLERNIENNGIISCHTDIIEGVDPTKLIKNKFKNRFPIKISNDIEFQKEANFNDSFNEYFCHAIFNIVLESSLENFLDIEQTFWDRPFITEKTVNAFLFYQMPIFLATRNHVKTLRELGFDLFDDIINHDYDIEEDVNIRIKKIADEIERLCRYNLNYFHNLDIEKRLEYNSYHIKKIFELKEKAYTNKIIDFLK